MNSSAALGTCHWRLTMLGGDMPIDEPGSFNRSLESKDIVVEDAGHITVCICTYKRPQLLERLLRALGQQSTGGFFSYSIVVADNDRLKSAETVVSTFSA